MAARYGPHPPNAVRMAKENEEHEMMLMRKAKSHENLMHGRQPFGASPGSPGNTQAKMSFLPTGPQWEVPGQFSPSRMGPQDQHSQYENKWKAANRYNENLQQKAPNAGAYGFGAQQAGAAIGKPLYEPGPGTVHSFKQGTRRRNSFHGEPVSAQGQNVNLQVTSFARPPQNYGKEGSSEVRYVGSNPSRAQPGAGYANNNAGYAVPGTKQAQYPEQERYFEQPQYLPRQQPQQQYQQTPQYTDQEQSPLQNVQNAQRNNRQNAPLQANNKTFAHQPQPANTKSPLSQREQLDKLINDPEKNAEVDRTAKAELDGEEKVAAAKCLARGHPNRQCPYRHPRRHHFGETLHNIIDGVELGEAVRTGASMENSLVAGMVKMRKPQILGDDGRLDPMRQRWPHLHAQPASTPMYGGQSALPG